MKTHQFLWKSTAQDFLLLGRKHPLQSAYGAFILAWLALTPHVHFLRQGSVVVLLWVGVWPAALAFIMAATGVALVALAAAGDLMGLIEKKLRG